MIVWVIAAVAGAAAVAFLARGMADLGQRIEEQKTTHDAIDALRRSGFDFEAAREIEFTLTFPSAEVAAAAGAELRALQYTVAVNGVACVARKAMPPALVGDRRQELEGVAKKFGGEYDGWTVG